MAYANNVMVFFFSFARERQKRSSVRLFAMRQQDCVGRESLLNDATRRKATQVNCRSAKRRKQPKVFWDGPTQRLDHH